MKKTIFFAICRYVPSLLRGESLNIGFVYHIPTLENLGFYESKNIKRLRSFDDELDSDTINMIFESLKYDFNSSPDIYLNDDLELPLTDSNLLKHKLYNYVNQIQFGEISVMEFDYVNQESVNNTLQDIADIYLYFDKPKSKRMSHERVKALARKIVKASDYADTLSNATNDNAVFYTQPYDFKIRLNDKPLYIKGFSFDYSQYKSFYKEMKSYLYDLNHAVYENGLEIDEVKIVINNTNLEKEHEKVITEILPDELEYYTLERFSSFLTENKEQTRMLVCN